MPKNEQLNIMGMYGNSWGLYQKAVLASISALGHYFVCIYQRNVNMEQAEKQTADANAKILED